MNKLLEKLNQLEGYTDLEHSDETLGKYFKRLHEMVLEIKELAEDLDR